jgi:hypothetical protein
MTRPQYEWRRVVHFPNGDRSVALGTGELQAREDCALAHESPWAQGLVVALERRRVGEWTEVSREVVGGEIERGGVPPSDPPEGERA